jgi:hypothetical protein
MAEAIGSSNETQVLNYGVADLTSFTPIYGAYLPLSPPWAARPRESRERMYHTVDANACLGIYENGVPVRVGIFNYVDDPSGANTVHAVISIAGETMPASVRVKYLAATTVVQKGGYTWAGQVCFCSFLSLRFYSISNPLILRIPSSSESAYPTRHIIPHIPPSPFLFTPPL